MLHRTPHLVSPNANSPTHKIPPPLTTPTPPTQTSTSVYPASPIHHVTALSHVNSSFIAKMSSSTGRTLTLTEELERLEQSITLTLQGKKLFASSSSGARFSRLRISSPSLLLTRLDNSKRSTIISARRTVLLPPVSCLLWSNTANIPNLSGRPQRFAGRPANSTTYHPSPPPPVAFFPDLLDDRS